MIGHTKTSAFSKVSCCNGKPAYRAEIAGYRGDIWRDGIYTWRLAVTSASEPLGSPAPTIAVQDFWKLAEAKAWFIRFAQEKAAAARKPLDFVDFVRKGPGHYSAIHYGVEYRIVRTCAGNYVAHTFEPPENHYGTPRGWFRSLLRAKTALLGVAARAQPGSKATRRKSAAPRGGRSGRERTT